MNGKRVKKQFIAAVLASLVIAGASATIPAVNAAEAPKNGSIMLDTANYIMAPGNIYDVGITVRDGNGNTIGADKVRNLFSSGKIKVRDSRTGSVVDLKQLPNGNFRVTGKNEGSCYILYEGGGTHASVRIDVKRGEKQHGTAVRNTSFFTQDMGLSGVSSQVPPTQNEKQKLQLVNSGYSIYKTGEYTHIPYAVEIKNPNQKYVVDFPTIHITAKDNQGKILKTETQMLFKIAANDTVRYGNEILFTSDKDTKVVEIELSQGDYIPSSQMNALKQSDFVVSNLTKSRSEYFGTKITGEVQNNSEVDCDMVCVTVVYKRDGKMVGGDVCFVSNVNSKSKMAFETTYDDFSDYDSYEVYAIEW